MNFNIDIQAIRDKAFSNKGSAYWTDPRDQDAIEEITVDKFDKDTVVEAITASEKLRENDVTILLECVETLCRLHGKYLLSEQNNIGFYWNGMLLLRVRVNGIGNKKELHVSLHRYELARDTLIAADRANRMDTLVITGFSSTVLLGTIIVGMNIWRNWN